MIRASKVSVLLGSAKGYIRKPCVLRVNIAHCREIVWIALGFYLDKVLKTQVLHEVLNGFPRAGGESLKQDKCGFIPAFSAFRNMEHIPSNGSSIPPLYPDYRARDYLIVVALTEKNSLAGRA